MRRVDLALLVAALAGIAALALAPEWLEPPLVALRDLPAHDGQAVQVEARVVRSYPAGAGAQVVTLADGTRETSAFWGAREPLEGAWVGASGAVEHSAGRWGLRLFRVEVLAGPEVPLTPDQAARLAPALKGQDIAVLGGLVWPEAGEPVLRGAGSALPLALASPGDAASLAGSRVLAQGTLAYEPERARYVLAAWEVRAA